MNRHLDVKLIKESLPALIMALVADSIAGYIMDKSIAVFIAVPGLLMMIPALIDMRGNVYGAFISRLSSALHLGEVENLEDKRVKVEIGATKSLAYSAALIVGTIVGMYISFVTGNYFYAIFLPGIILITHLFTASILTPLTAYIGVKTFQKGWNPDNIGVPLISSVGDMVSVFFIILVAVLFLYISNVPLAVVLIVILSLIYVFLLIRKSLREKVGKKIYMQSMPILIVIALLELITGSMWESNKIAIILLVVPVVNETLGNVGSIFSSRLTSFIYLGFVEPKILPRGKHFTKEIFSLITLSVIVYSIISLLVIFLSWDIRAVAMVWLAAFLSIFILIAIAYYLTIGSLKAKLDPDNVVVPVITTLADIIGTAALIFSYFLIF